MATLKCYICDINNNFNLILRTTNYYDFNYNNMTNGVSYSPQTVFETLCTSYSSQLSSHSTKQVVKYVYSSSTTVQLHSNGSYVNFDINNPSNLSALYEQATPSSMNFTGASKARFILFYIESTATYYYKLYKTDNSAYNGTTYGPYTMTSGSSYFVQDLIQQSYLASINNKYQVSQSTYLQVNFLNAEKSLITLLQNNTYYFNFFVQDTENYTLLSQSESITYQTGNRKEFVIQTNSYDTYLDSNNIQRQYDSLNSKEISILPIYPEYNSQLLLHVNSSNSNEFAIMVINNTIYQSLSSVINGSCSSVIQFIRKLENINNDIIKIYFDNGAVNMSSIVNGDSDWNNGMRGIGIISGNESRIKEFQISVTAQTQYYILIFTQPILNGNINRFESLITCNFISSNYFSYCVEDIISMESASIVGRPLHGNTYWFTVPNDNQNNIINLNYNDSSNTYQKILSPNSFSNYSFIGYSLEYDTLHLQFSKNPLSNFTDQLMIDNKIPFNCQYVSINSDGFCFIPNYLYNYQNYNQNPTQKELITLNNYNTPNSQLLALLYIYNKYYQNRELPQQTIYYNYTLDSNITYYSYYQNYSIINYYSFRKLLISSEFINFILNIFFPIADDGIISTNLTPITNRNFEKHLIKYSDFQQIFETSSLWTTNRNLLNTDKVWRNGTIYSL